MIAFIESNLTGVAVSHCLTSTAKTQCSESQQQKKRVSYVRRAQLHTLQQLDSSAHLLNTILFLCCTCIYWNSLGCQFVFDDRPAIVDNRDVKSHAPAWQLLVHDFWGTPIADEASHKSYRPVTVASFRLNYYLDQLNPTGYHLVNLLLHCAVTFVFKRVCRRVGRLSQAESWTAAFLFAVQPIHTEAVTGIVGRAELLSGLFSLLVLLFHHAVMENSCILSWLGMALSLVLAMLSKEQGLTAAGICACIELLDYRAATKRSTRRPSGKSRQLYQVLKRISFLVLLTGLLMCGRILVMDSTLPSFSPLDNPAMRAEGWAKFLTWSYLPALNVWLLVSNLGLCCDWTRATVPLVTLLSDVRNAATAATFLGLLLTICLRRERKVALGLTLLVVPFLPASNLFFPVGFVVAERVLYLPSLGFCWLVSVGYHRVRAFTAGSALQKKVWQCAFLALIALHCAQVVSRNKDWTDEESLYKSGLRVAPNNSKLLAQLGKSLHKRGNSHDAIALFRHAIHQERRDLDAYLGLGQALEALGNDEQAEVVYKTGLEVPASESALRPDLHIKVTRTYLNIHLERAKLIARNLSRTEEALGLFRDVISLRRDFVPAYIHLGLFYVKLNRSEAALHVYSEALEVTGETGSRANSDLMYNFAVLLHARHRYRESRRYLEAALALEPGHEQSRLMWESTAGRFNSSSSSSSEAEFRLAMLHAERDELQESEHWLREAVALQPDAAAALFNLALVLSRQDGRWRESKSVLTSQLLKHHPHHVKGLLLLAELYISHREADREEEDLKSAEACYKAILRRHPDHAQAMYNLCVVMVEVGDLEGARLCLLDAELRAPQAGYIQTNRLIVEQQLRKTASPEAEDASTPYSA